MATVTRPPAELESEVHYPESDGQPIGETPIHRRNLSDLIEMIADRFREDRLVYVSGNMFLYYAEGQPAKGVVPDVFVARGVDRGPRRRVYKTWAEGKGPDLVIELTSASTEEEDRVKKLAIYRDVLGVREYFLFDPEGEWLEPPLQGYRLEGGAYVPIAEVGGLVWSEVLGVSLDRRGESLRLFEAATGELIPNREEALEELSRAVAEQAAQNERLRREVEELRRQLKGD